MRQRQAVSLDRNDSDDVLDYADGRKAARKYVGPVDPASPIADATNWVSALGPFLDKHPRHPVVVLRRVSGRSQDYLETPFAQWITMRRFVRERGGVLVGGDEFAEVCSGWRRPYEGTDMLDRAVDLCVSEGAVLAALSVDRILRNFHYHSSQNPELTPTEAEFEMLAPRLRGVKMATAIPPIFSLAEVQAERNIIRSPRSKRPPGWLKIFHAPRISHSFRLRVLELSYGEIAKLVDAPRSNVERWCKKG